MKENNPKFIKGDILSKNITGHELIVCQQVNCKGVMGAGLAKQIRNQFPRLYEKYRQKCLTTRNSKELLGEVQFYFTYGDQPGMDFVIANIFGQDGYGRDKCYTDYNAQYCNPLNTVHYEQHNLLNILYKHLDCYISNKHN